MALKRKSLSARRRKFSFGLRTLLIAIAIAAIVSAQLATRYYEASRQIQIVENLSELGNLEISDDSGHLPPWLDTGRLARVSKFDVWTPGAGYDICMNAALLEEQDEIRRLARLKVPLRAIGQLSELQNLSLRATSVTDISELVSLFKLTELRLDKTRISSVTAISNMVELRVLDLRETNVSDISALAGLMSLEELLLSQTQVSDVAPLQNLTNLRKLVLSGTPVKDISSLTKLKNLEVLNLSDTQVRDISALGALPHLKALQLNGTRVTALLPLAQLKTIETIVFMDCPAKPADVIKLRSMLPNCRIYCRATEGDYL